MSRPPSAADPGAPRAGRLFATAAAAVVVLGGIGLGFALLQGLPNRFSPAALAILAQMQRTNEPVNYFRSGVCFLDREDKVDFLTSKGCLQTDPSRPNYLLIGDSYAAHLWYGLSQTFDKINVMQATAAGCTPLPARRFTRICNDVMRFLFSDYLLHHKPDRLVLSAEWLQADLPQLAQVLDWATAHDIRVILMGPIMRYDDRLPRLLAFAIEEKNPRLPDEHRLDYRALDDSLRQLAQEKGATYVSLLDLLCKEGACETLAEPGDAAAIRRRPSDQGRLGPRRRAPARRRWLCVGSGRGEIAGGGGLAEARNGTGGAEGDRTPDLLIANEALSQLSYGPRSRETGATMLTGSLAVKHGLRRDPGQGGLAPSPAAVNLRPHSPARMLPGPIGRT